MEKTIGRRIEWVDIFKGLAIILVVIGHATGKYNVFIYQFHMAAFFLISGYTASLDSRGFWETVWNKACSILLPLTSIFLIMLVTITGFYKIGIYNLFFDQPFMGAWFVLKQYFFSGNMYINWLGATWFLIVLFGIYIVQRGLFKLVGDKINLGYCIGSILMFILGYIFVANEIKVMNLDLIFIAQFYFFVGKLLRDKRIFEKICSNKWINVGILLITILGLWLFGFVNPSTVDYPSRNFGFIITDMIAGLNGALFIYCIAYYISKLGAYIKKPIITIGKNTLGIVFFHFLMFKITYFALYLCGIVNLEYLQEFTPTAEIGTKYWLIITAISILASIGFWKLITISKYMKIILGQAKDIYDNVYLKIRIWKIFEKLKGSKINIPTIKSIGDTEFITCILKHKIVVSFFIILLILIVAPIMITGIMCNDELQTRFYGMTGLKGLMSHYIRASMNQGRLLSAIPISIYFYIQFFSSNIIVFRTIVVIIIAINIGLFAYLLQQIFRNKRFSLFVSIMLLMFLNINFEHTVPNTFVGFLGIPFSMLLISLILFNKNLQTKSKKNVFIYTILLFISLCSYEGLITLMPIYPVLALRFSLKEQRSLKKFIKDIWIPVSVSVCYLGLYLISGKVVQTTYEGNQITFVSLKSSFEIIAQLFKSSLPGYYLFSKKYLYLFNLFTEHRFPIDSNTINSLMSSSINPSISILILGKQSIAYIFNNLLSLRIILLSSISSGMLYFILKGKAPKSQKVNKWKLTDTLTVIIGIIFIILPTLPIALSKMYQGNVNPESFIALPVTYFSYFAAIFTVCYIIFKIAGKIKNEKWLIAVILGMVVYIIPVQVMNDIFSKELNKQYNRMVQIENLFETSTIEFLNNQKVTAQDFYKTKNALAIHDNYWTDFANLKGLNIEATNEPIGNAEFNIYYQDDKMFVISARDKISVLSPQPILENIPIKISDTQYLLGSFSEYTIDNSFYVYNFQISRESSLIAVPVNEKLFEDMERAVGNTLQTADKVLGYHPDGWLERISEFKLFTGDLGKINITLYYPEQITSNLSGRIYINNDLPIEFEIIQPLETFVVNAIPNEVVNVRIEFDFEKQASEQDKRMVSALLNELKGE